MKQLVQLLLLLFSILAGCSDDDQLPKLSTKRNIVMQLNWTDDPTFTGEYLAKEHFWFLKKLNVTLKQGGIGVDPISMVLSGKADFAVVGADKALVAISDGQPLKIVSADFQRNPVGWIARRDLKVLNFDDLRGRTDIVLGDKSGTEVSAILKLVLDRKKLNIKPKGVSFDFGYFLVNKNSVYPVYLNEEPVKAELVHNVPINEIDPADSVNGGIRLYGNVIITHARNVTESSHTVKNFVSALSDGWEYAKNNPDEALDVVLKYVKSDREYVRQVMLRSVGFATNMYGRPVPAGHMEYTAWDDTINTLREGNLLNGQVNLEEAIFLWKN
jgi:ABC-type nitrate/sulfonate/bicarbonate transport system substrate-binding protein